MCYFGCKPCIPLRAPNMLLGALNVLFRHQMGYCGCDMWRCWVVCASFGTDFMLRWGILWGVCRSFVPLWTVWGAIWINLAGLVLSQLYARRLWLVLCSIKSFMIYYCVVLIHLRDALAWFVLVWAFMRQGVWTMGCFQAVWESVWVNFVPFGVVCEAISTTSCSSKIVVSWFVQIWCWFEPSVTDLSRCCPVLRPGLHAG